MMCGSCHAGAVSSPELRLGLGLRTGRGGAGVVGEGQQGQRCAGWLREGPGDELTPLPRTRVRIGKEEKRA